jgi:hypothetical protein
MMAADVDPVSPEEMAAYMLGREHGASLTKGTILISSSYIMKITKELEELRKLVPVVEELTRPSPWVTSLSGHQQCAHCQSLEWPREHASNCPWLIGQQTLRNIEAQKGD